MKKRVLHLVMIVAMGVMLSACSGNGKAEPSATPTASPETEVSPSPTGSTDKPSESPSDGDGEPAEEGSARHLMDTLLGQTERSPFIEADDQMLLDIYRLDAALFEDYTVLMPLMNVSSTEVAIFKLKDAKDLSAAEDGIKKRAEDVQKTFESYLPDQYENAKNYKLVSKGNYILFAIAQDAEKLAEDFQAQVK